MGDFSRNRPFSEKGARRTLRKFLTYERPDLVAYADAAHIYRDDGQDESEVGPLATSWAVWFTDDDTTSYIHHREEGEPDGPRNPIVVEWYGTGFDPDADEDESENQ